MVESVYKRQPRAVFSFKADRGSEPEAKTSPLMSRSRRSDRTPRSRQPLWPHSFHPQIQLQTPKYIIAENGPGIGLQIRIVDLNGDRRKDIVVAGKSGTHVLWNEGK